MNNEVRSTGTVPLNWNEVWYTNCHAAAPEFLEQAMKELIEENWKKDSAARLPRASILQASILRP